MKNYRKCVLISAATAVFTITAVGGVAMRQETLRKDATKLPRIVSMVRNIEVTGATIENPDSSSARLILNLKNKSGLAVTALGITLNEDSVSKDGGIDPDNPITVIEPYGSIRFDIPLSFLKEGVPIVVSSVIYADGAEDGVRKDIKWLHKHREHAKARVNAEKGKSKQ